MPFERVRTPEQINDEAEKLVESIPCLGVADARILAQASIHVPVHDQGNRLVHIVRRAILNRTTDIHVQEVLNRWLRSSTELRRQRRLERLAGNQ